MTYKNRIGQEIWFNDPVVYYGHQWYPYEGTFQGLSPAGQVKLQLSQKVRKIQGPHGKLYGLYSAVPFRRVPYTHYIHVESGYLIESTKFWELDIPYSERSKFKRDEEGLLRYGFKWVEVPRIFYGVMGLERLFKIETDQEPPF